MKLSVSLVLLVLAGLVAFPENAAAASQPGETQFLQHCAACHPGGGNIINPQKTLRKNDMQANNIKTAQDIIKTMRNPGPGMTKFDEKTLSDKDARQIADYIMKTFK